MTFYSKIVIKIRVPSSWIQFVIGTPVSSNTQRGIAVKNVFCSEVLIVIEAFLFRKELIILAIEAIGGIDVGGPVQDA